MFQLICGLILLIANKNIKLILNYVVGPLVFCILLYSIISQMKKQADWQQSFHSILQAFSSASVWQLALVLLLMAVNWGIEARKWQLAIRPVVQISFSTSFRAIFSGTTMAFFTPNRMGEYMGRILHIEEGKRISAVALTVICSIAQLVVTLLAGITGLYFIRKMLIASQTQDTGTLFWVNTMLYLTTACAIFLTLFYFRLNMVVSWLEKIPGIDRWLKDVKTLQGFNATILVRILSLSFGRYLVFIAQYYLLFRVFGVSLDWWQAFWSVSTVFLVIAVIPSIAAITELGVRWKASIEVIQLFSSNTAGIMATSLAAWIINLVIPALIGSLLILRIKIFRHT